MGVYRGNLEDVGSRLLETAISKNADAFIRISADSPFIDWRIVDHAVSLYQACHPDLVTNIFPRTFPKGQSVEIIKTSTLAGICKIERTPQQKEHVTPYFYDHFKEFRIVSFTSGIDSSDSVHCIDDQDDFERAEEIVKEIGHDNWSWQDLDEFLQKESLELPDKIQAGVIGLGVGESHVLGLQSHPMCEVKAICDINEEVLQRVGKKYPSCKTFHRSGLGAE